MAKSFNLGVSKYIPNAKIVTDKYHFSSNSYKNYVKKMLVNEIKTTVLKNRKTLIRSLCFKLLFSFEFFQLFLRNTGVSDYKFIRYIV